MGLSIDRAIPADVTKTNPSDPSRIYVKGSESVDGSLRLTPDLEHGETGIQFELRAEGVWNVTTIDLLGEDAIALGHSLELGLLGAHLRLFESNGEESVIPARHYNNTVGSADADESLALDPRIDKSIIQPDDSGVLTGVDTPIAWEFAMGLEKVIQSVWIRPAVTFDTNVEIILRKDSSTGNILHRRNYPAAQFIGGLDIEFTIPGMFEIENFETIWFEIIQEDGTGTISLQTEVNNLIPWLAITFFISERVPIMNYHHGVDAIIYEAVNVGTEGQPLIIYPAILTNEGNQTTVVPATTV